MFAVLENLRIFQNCFFTEGVVNGNCILPANSKSPYLLIYPRKSV